MGFLYCVARIHESSFRTLRGDVLEEFIPKDNLFGGNRVSLKNRLQALAVVEPSLMIFPDRVILRMDPAFLPKVATSFHRSPEIVFLTFSSAPANPRAEAFHTLDVRRCLGQFLNVLVMVR